MASATDVIDSHVTRKYEIKKRLGKGAYGIVWKAVDTRTNQTVALKKIFDAFRNKTDAQRTFREVMFLMEFTIHPNIISLRNILKADNDRDIYLVFDFMDTDLHNVIKKGNILKPIHKQYIMYQLFKAVMYLHSGNVLHRDLKPSNVLLDVNCTVKLADFGLSRSLAQLEHDYDDSPSLPELTEYVATRWYRAPEILLSAKRYTKGVDMWSLACILAEMWLGKSLFPGTSTMNQIERIMQVVTAPSDEDIEAIGSLYAHSVLTKMPKKQQSCISTICNEAPPSALDLISKILIFNPEKRLTILQALDHPYVGQFRAPHEEPVLNYDVALSLNDDVQLSVSAYRNKLYEMLVHKTPHIRRIYHHDSRAGQRRNKSATGLLSRRSSAVQENLQHCPPRSHSTNTIKADNVSTHETQTESNATPQTDPSSKENTHAGAPLAGPEPSEIDTNTNRLQATDRSGSDGDLLSAKISSRNQAKGSIQNGYPAMSDGGAMANGKMGQSQSTTVLDASQPTIDSDGCKAVPNGRAHRAFETFSKTIGNSLKGSSYERLAAYFAGVDRPTQKEPPIIPAPVHFDPSKQRHSRIWTVGVTRKIFRNVSRDRSRPKNAAATKALRAADSTYINFNGIDSLNPNANNASVFKPGTVIGNRAARESDSGSTVDQKSGSTVNSVG